MINAKVKRNYKVITTIFFALVLSNVLVIKQGVEVTWQIYYLLEAAFILFIILTNLFSNRGWVIIREKNSLSIIPILMFFIWGYGIVRGLINGNYIGYIIKNNAGILIYIFFYVLINADIKMINISKLLEDFSSLIIIITFIGFVIINYAPLPMISKYLEIPILNCIQIGSAIGKYQPVLHYGRDLIYICYGCTLWDFLDGKGIVNKSLFKLLFVIFVVFVVMKSGGAELAIIMNTIFIVLSFVGKKMDRKNLLLIFSSLLIGITYFIYKNINPFLPIFSKADAGNSVRYNQIDYCIKNMTFLGKGFGVDFSDIGRKYMIEISYIDLLYKIGIFAIIVFVIHLITVFKAFIYMKTNHNRYAVIPICSMSFLYTSLGNNGLFHNNNVLINVIVLYYLLGIIRIKNQKNSC